MCTYPFPLSSMCVCVTIQPTSPLASSFHAVCDAHSTSHTPPLIESGPQIQNMDYREKGAAERRVHTLFHPCVPIQPDTPFVSFIDILCGAYLASRTPSLSSMLCMFLLGQPHPFSVLSMVCMAWFRDGYCWLNGPTWKAWMTEKGTIN